MKFLSHTKEEAFEIIKELVARFKQNEKSYTSVSYDESNTRTDFIDKFFEALNWDVRNDNGFAERFREVVREDKVVINGQTKAPDYSFRLGGQKIFFVEAKKPSVNIKDDIAPAYQVRRYAYTAKLPPLECPPILSGFLYLDPIISRYSTAFFWPSVSGR